MPAIDIEDVSDLDEVLRLPDPEYANGCQSRPDKARDSPLRTFHLYLYMILFWA